MNDILETEIGLLFGLISEKSNQEMKKLSDGHHEDTVKGNANTLMSL